MRKFQMGTPECGLLCGVIGVVIAVLILFLGFWRTAFIALLFAIGYFWGSVENKSEAVKRVLNKLLPPQDE